MKASYLYIAIALIAIVTQSTSTCYSGELDFEIRAGIGEGKSRDVALKFGYDDSGGEGARAVAAYEQKPKEVGQEEKFEAFRYYLFKLKFIEAERLAEKLALESNESNTKGRAAVAVGLARLCRGDYARSVASLKTAEESGIRPAAHLRVYVSCMILQTPEDAETTVKQMLKSGELNASRLAASAVLGFCLVGRDGPK